ncbi:ovochymase-1 [Caerostris extrusa]|uniref:Ovochymase-1 n=1 Tax=Caerostris extrusa TaxID=172846 RepID=A0AAV4QVV5_CAEEX|nr:ovochymase-1 [Caerostris extrusa]
MRSCLSVLWLFAVYLFTTRIVQSYDDEDYKKDPNYIYCYRPYEFDVRVNRTGHIYSPKYFEGGYPPEIGCSWHISFPENYALITDFYKFHRESKFTVKDMDIQISTRCSDDKLTFLGEDESKIITVLCGSEPLPRPVYSLKGDK